MGKKQWLKSAGGPDWTDCLGLVKAIEALHGVLVVVSLGADSFDGPGGYITIAALRVDRDASVLGSPVAVLSGDWPCPDHADLGSCLFAGLHAMDVELARKVWQQSSLPFTAE